MKRTALAVTALLLGASLLAPAASASVAAASPVPGRFCKVADIGKKVKTAKYGLVICKREGDRARWK
jgi:hypothetical protein